MLRLSLLCLAIIGATACAQKNATVNPSAIDRTSPRATAVASLRAYKAKDLPTLKALATTLHANAIDQLLLHPELVESRRVFADWRWQLLQQWDGNNIGEMRINLETKRLYVVFHQPDKATPATKIGVVALDLEEEKWCFVDIFEPTLGEYQTLLLVENSND